MNGEQERAAAVAVIAYDAVPVRPRYRRAIRACPDATATPLIMLPLKHTRGRDTAGIALRTYDNAFARRVTAGSPTTTAPVPTLVPTWT